MLVPIFLSQTDEFPGSSGQVAVFSVTDAEVPGRMVRQNEAGYAAVRRVHIISGQDAAAQGGPHHGHDAGSAGCFQKDVRFKACLLEFLGFHHTMDFQLCFFF